jgi:hypothetical protein
LVLTLVLIAFCAPLALEFSHRPLGPRYLKTDVIAYALATLVPAAVTGLAACSAVVWIVRAGTTRRGRTVWKALLTTAFLLSRLGYAVVFFISLLIAGAEYGIH